MTGDRDEPPYGHMYWQLKKNHIALMQAHWDLKQKHEKLIRQTTPLTPAWRKMVAKYLR